MKKLIIITILVLLLGSICAQQYNPFPDSLRMKYKRIPNLDSFLTFEVDSSIIYGNTTDWETVIVDGKEIIRYVPLDTIWASDPGGGQTFKLDTIPRILIYIDTALQLYMVEDLMSMVNITPSGGISTISPRDTVSFYEYSLHWMKGYDVNEIENGAGHWSVRHKEYLDENRQRLPHNIIVLMTK